MPKRPPEMIFIKLRKFARNVVKLLSSNERGYSCQSKLLRVFFALSWHDVVLRGEN